MELNKFVYNLSSKEPSKEKASHTCPHCRKTDTWGYNLNHHIKANHGVLLKSVQIVKSPLTGRTT